MRGSGISVLAVLLGVITVGLAYVINERNHEINQLKTEREQLQTALQSCEAELQGYENDLSGRRWVLVEPMPQGVPNLFPGCENRLFSGEIDFKKSESCHLAVPLIFPEFEGKGQVIGVLVVIPPGTKKLPIPIFPLPGGSDKNILTSDF
ncbi:MAG: hypothetical protein ABH822_01990 [Patescibacteria group bacterium]